MIKYFRSSIDLIAISVFATGCVFATIAPALAQTFSSYEECRAQYQLMFTELNALHEEMRVCMSGGLRYADVKGCSYGNQGPYVSHGMTAYADCSDLEVQICETNIRQNQIGDVCSQMSSDLLNAVRQGDIEAKNQIKGIIDQDSQGTQALSSQYVYAERLRSAAGRPKTLLLGSYFNKEVLATYGQTPQEIYGNEYEYGDTLASNNNPYDLLLSKIKAVPLDVRTAIDSELRTLFPSYSHSNTPMSDEDLKKMKSVLTKGGKAFFSKTPGIRAIQKQLLAGIIDAQSSLIVQAKEQYSGFENDLNRGEYNQNTSRFIQAYQGYQQSVFEQQQNTTYSEPANEVIESGDDDTAEALSAVSGILDAIVKGSAQQSPQQPSVGQGQCGGDDHSLILC